MASPQRKPDTRALDELSAILSTSSSSTSAAARYKPASADASLLLPSTVARAVDKRHVAHLRVLRHERQSHDTHPLSLRTVKDTVAALYDLRAHYEHMVANSGAVRTAMAGFDNGAALWVDVHTRRDFVHFIRSLSAKYDGAGANGNNRYYKLLDADGGKKLSNLVEWAMDPDIDAKQLRCSVNASSRNYQSVEQAFNTFRHAFDEMVDFHAQSVSTNASTQTNLAVEQ